MLKKTIANSDYELNVLSLIQRVIDNKHDINDFIVVINETLNENGLDTFQVILM